MKIHLMTVETAHLTTQIPCELEGNCPPPYDFENVYMQDTRGWYAVHGGGYTSSMNMLMADGSVKSFFDTNNDKMLNPGFPVEEGLSDHDYANLGFHDDTIEMPLTEFFSGMFLIRMSKHAIFE